MERSKKWPVLLAALVLVFGMLTFAGCGGTESSGTDEAPGGITSTDDLKSGDKVGVQSGTTGEQWSKDNLAPKGVEVVAYDDVLLAFQALQAGDVDAVVNDLPISQYVVAEEARGLKIVQEISTDECYGFAFNKDDTVLRDSVDWALAQVIADGTYADIYQAWFGAQPAAIPEATSGVTEKPSGDLGTITPGKIVIGSDTAFPPFENVEDGQIVGFDVDLMNAIGEKLGVAVEFKSYKFDALITGVQAGTEFDMIASAMTITSERQQSIDFSDPYINSNQSLTVRAE